MVFLLLACRFFFSLLLHGTFASLIAIEMFAVLTYMLFLFFFSNNVKMAKQQNTIEHTKKKEVDLSL